MTTPPRETRRELPLSQLAPGPNTRTEFSDKALAELADSIRAQGVLQPLLVRPYPLPVGTGSTPVPDSPAFQIIAGERRFRAATLAGLATVPCTIRECTDVEAAELQLIENLQREGVHRLDEAARLRQLIESGLPCARVDVRGDDGVHFEATVVCAAFAGKLPLARHRMVYATLGELMGGAIHALQLKTVTPDEVNR